MDDKDDPSPFCVDHPHQSPQEMFLELGGKVPWVLFRPTSKGKSCLDLRQACEDALDDGAVGPELELVASFGTQSVILRAMRASIALHVLQKLYTHPAK